MDVARINLLAAWIGILAGIVAGAVAGLFFHDENWLGGYSSYRRRMIRLGHISLFGLAIINALFSFTVRALALSHNAVKVAAVCFIAGAAAMPVCCFLAAWRKPLRVLFPLPVVCVLGGVIFLLVAWSAR